VVRCRSSFRVEVRALTIVGAVAAVTGGVVASSGGAAATAVGATFCSGDDDQQRRRHCSTSPSKMKVDDNASTPSTTHQP